MKKLLNKLFDLDKLGPLQILHWFDPDYNKGGATLAMRIPNKGYILDRYVDGQIFTVEMGRATCHPKERYIKKEGARLAKERMEKYQAKLGTYTDKAENTVFMRLEVCKNFEERDQEHHSFTIRLTSTSDLVIIKMR